jgi:hypothetical protein
MSWSADLQQHGVWVNDPQPTNIETDSSGLDFGPGFPGVLGSGRSITATPEIAHRPNDLISFGYPGEDNDANGINPLAMLRSNSSGWTPNPEYGGEPGRVRRLAADIVGPAHVGTVESFAMNGARIRPGRPDIARGGPVGASNDLGQYLAVAMAASTYDFPAQDQSQLNVLLGI